MRFKYLNDRDPWMLAEEIPNTDLFFTQIWLSCFVNEFKTPGGKAFKKILSIYKGYHQWFYFGERDSFKVGDHLVKKFIKNPGFTVRINKEIVRWSDILRKYCEKLPQEHLEEYSNKELWEFYEKHDRLHTQYYQWGWIPVGVDMFHNNLTEALKEYLRSIPVKEELINEYLVLLTHPKKKSLIRLEQEEFRKIALKIKKNKKQEKLFRDLFDNFREKEAAKYGLATHTPEYESALEARVSAIKDEIKPSILKSIQNHYLRYYYTKHMWTEEQGVYSFDYYLKEMVRLVGSGVNIRRELEKEESENKKILKKRLMLIKKLKIKNPWLTLINSWGDFMVTKIYRRYAQIFAIYRMEFIQREIVRRFGLKLKEVRFLLPKEIKTLLLKGRVKRQELKKRVKFCVYYAEEGREFILTGKKSKTLAEKVIKKKVEGINEIKGQCGCVGKARGVVKRVFRPKDMIKMKKGDILVSIATDPDIVPAMKKAAAIITEQGGVTSHAAIVSRELNIPCVIGTKIATKVLKDGDKVLVDATKGLVKKL